MHNVTPSFHPYPSYCPLPVVPIDHGTLHVRPFKPDE